MKSPLLFILTLLTISLSAQTFQPNDNSKTSLDWPGTYTGTLPCRDCPGIPIVITLTSKDEYQTSELYPNKKTPVVNKGKFIWQKDYSRITLKGKRAYQFLVAENQLVPLDSKGERSSASDASAYILKKTDHEIREKYWKLISIKGTAINRSQLVKEPHIIFKRDSARVFGYAGCNSFGGTYSTSAGQKIQLSKIHSTLMACSNMEIENSFMKALQNVEFYEVNNDTLILKNAAMKPLARFEVVYLR